MKKMNWKKAKQIIQKNKRFALTAHMYPDGDAIGAEMALYHYLTALGKEVRVINNQPTMSTHTFLDPKGVIELFNESKHPQVLAGVDVIFIVDVSSWDYMGHVGESVKNSSAFKICIDHHVKKGALGDLDFIDETTCATGELVYDMFQQIKAKITIPMATALYTAIITDTGVFRFSNTTARAHLIAADLLEIGIDHNKIYQSLYEANSWPKMHLLKECLSEIRSEEKGKIAWVLITDKMVKKYKATWDDSNNLIDMLRTIEGVKISIIFRELEKGSLKIHFRSKDGIDIQPLAHKLGGGGHRVAAGASVNGAPKKLIPKILAEAKKLL